LLAAGADLTRVKFTKPMRIAHDSKGNPYFVPQSFQDLDYWADLLTLYPNAGLLIADPLPAYIGRGVNDHKNSDLRQVLEPFFDYLETKGMTSLGITHVGKSNDGRKAIHRGLGSVAYGNRARGAFGTNLDTNDPSGVNRLFCHIKPFNATLQPTLVYKIVPTTIESDSGPIATSRVEFQEGTDARTAEDVMSHPAKRGGGLKKREDLADWLRRELADGAVESEEIKRRAKGAGFGRDMLWEVKTEIGVKAIKDGLEGGWFWSLPTKTSPYASEDENYNF
jgi:putative DNA primase/helicase